MAIEKATQLSFVIIDNLIEQAQKEQDKDRIANLIASGTCYLTCRNAQFCEDIYPNSCTYIDIDLPGFREDD
jgi:hypothetical protein